MSSDHSCRTSFLQPLVKACKGRDAESFCCVSDHRANGNKDSFSIKAFPSKYALIPHLPKIPAGDAESSLPRIRCISPMQISKKTSLEKETLDSTTSSSSQTNDSKRQNLNLTSSPLPPTVVRLWRPAAQRNLRNQWSKLASYRNQWSSISSVGRSHATAIVNSHLSQRYMPNMDLGVLHDMPDIRKRACFKLSKQQELLRSQLLSTYLDMVAVVSDIIDTARSMRCFFKGANNSPLLQFTSFSEDKSDSGDGGGIPVFSFLSISSHEELAEELVQMFRWELCLKRLLILEFLSIGYDISQANQLNWSNELYAGEFNHLRNCNLYCEETCGPVPPRLRDGKSDMDALKLDKQLKPEVLKVYLTTWLAEVNIDTFRLDEIFAVVGEEMHVSIF